MQRFLAVLLGLLVLVALAGYLVLDRRQKAALDVARASEAQRLAEQQHEAMGVARELAEDAVRVLAATVADQVFMGDTDHLEATLARAVQGHRLVGVLVLDAEGGVLSSTDLRYRGRTMDDPETRAALAATSVVVAQEAPAPGQIEVHAPLVAAGEHVGVLRVFVQLEGP